MRITTVARASFLIRLRVQSDGTWAGQVEHLRSGWKETFHDPQELLDRFQHFYEEKVLPEMHDVDPETRIDTTIMARVPALRHEPDSAAVKLVQALTSETSMFKVPFAAEAGQFQRAGFPTVICGPGSIDQAHKPDEFISLEQLDKGEAFMRQLIRHLSASA